MKILILNDDFPPESTGGAAIVVDRLSKKLIQLGHQVKLITTSRKRERITTSHKRTIYWLKENYHLKWRAYKSLNNPSALSKVKAIINKFKPDVIHANNIHTYISYASLEVSKSRGIPVVYTGHDVMPIFYHRLNQFIDKDENGIPDKLDYHYHFFEELIKNKLHFFPLRNSIIRNYLKYSKVVTVSAALKEVYQTNNIKVNKVIHNGIDVKTWEKSNNKVNSFKTKYKLNQKNILFYGGRIRQDKGSLQVIKILHQLPIDSLLVIAGNKDIHTKRMASLSEKLGVRKKVIFTGLLSQIDMITAYHASDIILVPSLCFDSFPNTVIEGMACQKVVVAGKFGGAKEAIKNNYSGIIINPFDLLDTTNKIDQVLSDNREYQRLATNAYDTVLNKFSVTIQAKKYLHLYNSIINK